jgi:hypothetical protein
MNKNKIILYLSIPLIFLITGNCKRKTDNAIIDFLNDQDRIGLWVNHVRNDTLEFKTSNLLIRHYGETMEYNYRIVGSILFIKLPNTESETQHWITKTENAKVTLQNMYIGFEETDNSGVFIKIL